VEVGYFSFLQNWAANNVEAPVFYMLAFLAIPLAYGVLFDPRIIRCGFLLIGVFGTISGIFLLLQAQFLAMAQLMIYAVGITLVVVIALMLTNPRMEQDVNLTVPEQKLPALFAALALFITIYLAIRSELWQVKEATPLPPELNLVAIGTNMLGYYALPFEFASVLLLIALIGAIMLAKTEHLTRSEEWIENDESYSDRKEENVVKV